MKKLILIPCRKGNIIIILVLLSLIIILISYIKSHENFTTLNIIDDDIENLKTENYKLKNTITSILPDEIKIVYDDYYRNYGNYKPNYKEVNLSSVLSQGSKINFDKIYENQNYYRPIYDPSWRDFYFRGWLYLPQHISVSSHKLFMFPIGASMNFDFTGILGFNENAVIDSHKNINLLIYNFSVDKIVKFKHQVALVGKPKRNGVEIVKIDVDHLIKGEEEELLFQLSTPKGYEIDYLYSDYTKSPYREPSKETLNTIIDKDEIKKLLLENKILKNELSYYIPLEEKIIGADKCDEYTNLSINLDNNFKDKSINFNPNYNNPNYRRPIYHPVWKKEYKEGLSYLPRKICESMKNIFVLPKDNNDKKNLLKSLGFFQNYKEIPDDNIGFLVYNFNLQSVVLKDNIILFLGTPTRLGSQIVSFKKEILSSDTEYVLRLMTLDNFEYDITTFKIDK